MIERIYVESSWAGNSVTGYFIKRFMNDGYTNFEYFKEWCKPWNFENPVLSLRTLTLNLMYPEIVQAILSDYISFRIEYMPQLKIEWMP